MQASDLARKIKDGNPPIVLDARSGFEYRSGHIPGAIHAPFMKVLFRLAKLPEDKGQLVVLTCEHGPRAQMVMSALSRSGYSKIELLEGHMAKWRKAKLPLEK